MTGRRSVSTRLLLAASLLAGVASTHPVQAEPFGYVVSLAPGLVTHSIIPGGAVIQRSHYVPPAPDRFDPFPPEPTSADVLPAPHGDADARSFKLAPGTVHYQRSPIGLDDSPTTMGFVARF
jgi:hypothetical protein